MSAAAYAFPIAVALTVRGAEFVSVAGSSKPDAEPLRPVAA